MAIDSEFSLLNMLIFHSFLYVYQGEKCWKCALQTTSKNDCRTRRPFPTDHKWFMVAAGQKQQSWRQAMISGWMRMYALWILWESTCGPPGSPPIAEQKADYAQRKSPADQELILAFLYSQVRKTCWHIFAELQCCQTLKWLEHPAKVSAFGKQIHLSANSCLQLWGTFPARTAVGVWLICLGKSSTSFGDGAWGKSRPRGALQQRLVRSSSHPFTNFCLAWERASP